MERYKRLNKIISLVEKEQRVLDIGTDHALVPILLTKSNLSVIADGSDLKDNPINIAKENIKVNNLEKKINILKSDGLKNININNYDLFIIAGLGGKSISNILQAKKITQDLILHPTNHSYLLRSVLKKLKYKIIYEEILFENNVNNLIIKAVKNNRKIHYSYKELVIGPYLKLDNSNFTHNYYVEKMNNYKKIYELSNKKEYQKKYKVFKKGLD